MMRWEAEQESRFSALDDGSEIRIPDIKFSTNDGWLVFPAECRVIASALNALTPGIIQEVLEADEDEIAAINDPAVEDPADLPTAIENVLRYTASFARYCETAADYGGFRVH